MSKEPLIIIDAHKSTERECAHKEPVPQNAALGITLFITSQVVANLNQTCAKVVYETHPEITTAQLLCYRAITCVLIQVLWLHT